jgi:hypothetical protein
MSSLKIKKILRYTCVLCLLGMPLSIAYAIWFNNENNTSQKMFFTFLVFAVCSYWAGNILDKTYTDEHKDKNKRVDKE